MIEREGGEEGGEGKRGSTQRGKGVFGRKKRRRGRRRRRIWDPVAHGSSTNGENHLNNQNENEEGSLVVTYYFPKRDVNNIITQMKHKNETRKGKSMWYSYSHEKQDGDNEEKNADFSVIDPRFIFMPIVDIRIVLQWVWFSSNISCPFSSYPSPSFPFILLSFSLLLFLLLLFLFSSHIFSNFS